MNPLLSNETMPGDVSYVLYDTVESFYCQIARIALHENKVRYTSHYLNMQK